MRIYNKYILLLGIAFSLVTFLLALGRVTDIFGYFSAYVITYLGLTILFGYFHPRARLSLDIIGFVVFSGLMYIFVIKLVETILAG